MEKSNKKIMKSRLIIYSIGEHIKDFLSNILLISWITELSQESMGKIFDFLK